MVDRLGAHPTSTPGTSAPSEVLPDNQSPPGLDIPMLCQDSSSMSHAWLLCITAYVSGFIYIQPRLALHGISFQESVLLDNIPSPGLNILMLCQDLSSMNHAWLLCIAAYVSGFVYIQPCLAPHKKPFQESLMYLWTRLAVCVPGRSAGSVSVCLVLLLDLSRSML